MRSFRLDDRVAVVIGGSGALGRSIAATLADAGARTVIVGRDPARGRAALDALATGDRSVTFAACDVARSDELELLVRRVVAEHGRVDVLVNGAGINSATPFLEIPDEELERIVAVNQLAVARSCRAFGAYFVDRARTNQIGASIINVGSLAGDLPLSRVFTYAMTKAAVHNLTKNLAREWGPLSIRCNVLVPGFFPAEQNRRILTEERVTDILRHTPMGRFGDPDDLAGAVLLLASDAGAFITGAEIVVDGGFSAVSI